MITNVNFTVKLKVETDKPLTEEQLQQLIADVDYDFYFDEKGLEIIGAEIIDGSII